MKIALFFSLLIAGITFGQSKSDLKAQVVSYQQRLDSMNLVLEKTQHINDSLSSEIKQKENALKNKQATLDYRTKELEDLNFQIENLKSSKKEEPISKIRPPNTNPFGTGGGNGSGNGSHTLGDDNGDGGRYLIKKPNTSAISSEESCRIVFQVMVDENGEIIGIPTVSKINTTTSDQVLIQKISAIIKSQAKYNPVKGAPNKEEIITIRINPN